MVSESVVIPQQIRAKQRQLALFKSDKNRVINFRRPVYRPIKNKLRLIK